MLRNKSIRRPGTTPMGSGAFFYGDNDASWMTSPRQRSHKDKPRAGYRKSRSGVQGNLEAESRWIFEKDLDRRSMGLNRGDRREWIIQLVKSAKSVQ